MIRSALFTLASTISLGGCADRAVAAPAAPGHRYLAAMLLAGESGSQPVARAEPEVAPAVRRVRAAGSQIARGGRAEVPAGAALVQPWTDGSTYRLITAPERVSDIALQSGENLISVAAGDTARWVIGDTVSGSGATRRTHVLVKPSNAGLRTNLVIATDRRVYHVDIESRPAAGAASLSWTYPEDALLALRGASAAGSQPVAVDVPVDTLNFSYRIEGDRPPWRPVRAFDDGRQIFIEFPPAIAAGEAPPLFVRGAGGRAELVNYRVSGRYYVVDRLFAAAELRLGERRQQVVRIVRDGRRGS